MKTALLSARLKEQLEYYRLGAAEYDNANRGLLESNTGAPWETDYRRGYKDATEALAQVVKDRDVLELAGGTGLYTSLLARMALTLTVLDGAKETLDINRHHTSRIRDDVEYVVTDIFSWSPSREYEAVVFAFWLSHVPLSRFDDFWQNLRGALVTGGEVVFIDSKVSAKEQGNRSDEPLIFREKRLSEDSCTRSLSDGTAYKIFRVLWSPEQLSRRLNRLGWSVCINLDSPWLIGSAKPG